MGKLQGNSFLSPGFIKEASPPCPGILSPLPRERMAIIFDFCRVWGRAADPLRKKDSSGRADVGIGPYHPPTNVS